MGTVPPKCCIWGFGHAVLCAHFSFLLVSGAIAVKGEACGTLTWILMGHLFIHLYDVSYHFRNENTGLRPARPSCSVEVGDHIWMALVISHRLNCNY